MHLFPDIGLDERHFNSTLHPQSLLFLFLFLFHHWLIVNLDYWADYLHRKHLFVEYSIAAGFQPHDPVMWESTNLVNILTLKVPRYCFV